MLKTTRKIRKRVLIVTEDQDLAQATATVLRRDQVRCDSAFTLADARAKWAEAVNNQELTYDTLIVDGVMSDGDGLGFCHEVRKDTRVPLLFLSPEDADAELGRVLVDQVGVDLVLSKPISLSVLTSNIVHLVVNRGARTSAVRTVVGDILRSTDRAATLESLASEFATRIPERLVELDRARDEFMQSPSRDLAKAWRQVAQRALSGAATFGFRSLTDAAQALDAKLALLLRHGNEAFANLEVEELTALQNDIRSAFDLHLRGIPEVSSEKSSAQRSLLLMSRPGSAIAKRLSSMLDKSWMVEVASSLIAARDLTRDIAVDLVVVDCDLFAEEEAHDMAEWAEQNLAAKVLMLTSQPAYERGEGQFPVMARLLPADNAELNELFEDAISTVARWKVVVVDADRSVNELVKRALPTHVEVYRIGESHDIEQDLVDLAPDFIVMDLNLMAYDGRDICRKLRRRAVLSTVPLLITTDSNNPAERIAIFEAGADDFMLKPMPEREIRARVLGRLKRDQILRNMSRTDPLTGLNNRREFQRAFTSQLDATVRDGTRMCVVMIDLDHFKEVNDSHGHAAGDNVLKSFARLLRSSTRTSDLIGRLGGEEFGVVLRRTDVKGAVEVVKRIRKALAGISFHDSAQGPFQVTMSAGISTFPDNGKDLEELLTIADNALYEAKHEGRDRIIMVMPDGTRKDAVAASRAAKDDTAESSE